MAQIDKIIYIPLIFWFIVLLVAIYMIVFSLFLCTFLSMGKARVLFFFELGSYINESANNVGSLKAYNAIKFLIGSAVFGKIAN